MTPWRRSRRALLREGAALGALGAVGTTSGCLGFFESEPDLGRLATVPIGTKFVVRGDVPAMLADEAVREGADEELAEDNVLLDGANSVDELLTEFRDGTGLDAGDISDVLAFGQFVADEDEEPFLATLAWTDWTTAGVREAVEGLADVSTESYAGHTVYATDDVWVAALDDGVFATGTPLTVQSVIDLRNDEEAVPVSGPTREAYLSAKEGHLQYGFEVDASSITSIPARTVNQSLLDDIDYGYGSVYPDGDERVAELSLQAVGTTEAEDVASILRGAVALGREREENQSVALLERLLVEAADDITVTRDDDLVRLEYRNDARASGSVLVRLVSILEGALVQF